MLKGERYNVFFLAIATALLLVFLLIGFIAYAAYPVIAKEGFGFIFGSVWDYDSNQYGILFWLVGTIVVTCVTMIIACPLAMFTAVYLSEWAPSWVAKPSRVMIELLVGIPSVVYGIFGFFALSTFFRDSLNPFIDNILGFIPIFHYTTRAHGTGILLASVILTIMILPTVTVLSIEAMQSLPKDYREASLALGATRWQTMKKVVFPAALAGIITAFILGMMRAMGETMAVVMLLGNNAHIPTSLLDNAGALPGKILADVNYYSSFPEPRAALFSIALVLFILECIMVAAVRLISSYIRRKMH